MYYILLVASLCCFACDLNVGTGATKKDKMLVEVVRFDQLESRYLTTGDFSALQDMQTEYTEETRSLIEDVTKIGSSNEPNITSKFLTFFQDTLLQNLISEVEVQYSDMSDINKALSKSFQRAQKALPNMTIPTVYAQIGSLDQSVVVNKNTIGISLDKYLGSDYALYKRFYNEEQRATMTRDYIVADCLGFYLFSLYPTCCNKYKTEEEKQWHIAVVQWVVNHLSGKTYFQTDEVRKVQVYMQKNKDFSVQKLLEVCNYRFIFES